jgi:cytochrome c-type biogenesis protein CcmE
MNKKKRRMALVLVLLFAMAAIGFVSMGNIGENLVYYWNTSELVAQGDKAFGADIRLGGVVKEGSLKWDESKNELEFEIGDGEHFVKVFAKGAPPQMFREGIGVLVEGTMVSEGFFKSNRLMVKHSNEYKAPEDGQEVKELYKTVENL